MAAGSPINLDPQISKQRNSWDLLWPIFKAHHGTKGILKFYHAGQTEHILSESGTQQGDPVGNILFSAPSHFDRYC